MNKIKLSFKFWIVSIASFIFLALLLISRTLDINNSVKQGIMISAFIYLILIIIWFISTKQDSKRLKGKTWDKIYKGALVKFIVMGILCVVAGIITLKKTSADNITALPFVFFLLIVGFFLIFGSGLLVRLERKLIGWTIGNKRKN